MKYLSLAIVFAAATCISLSFRHGLSGSSEAARQEPARERLVPQGVEEAAFLPVELASSDTDDRKADLEFARIAAATGNKLLGRALQSPDKPLLFRQAAAHYRACLTHEATATKAGDLFVEVREKLAVIDRELARASRPAIAKPTPRAIPAPAIVKAAPATIKAETPKPKAAEKAELIMVGPDGVPIERAAPRE